MHMHRAADLATDEPIWLKKAPGYFSPVSAAEGGFLDKIKSFFSKSEPAAVETTRSEIRSRRRNSGKSLHL